MTVVILLKRNYQSMVMQHLNGKNLYNNLDPCINNKIHSRLLKFIRQHKMYFTKPEWNL